MKKDLAPFETKLRKTGSAAGVTIPAEFLRHLGYDIGDTLKVSVDEQNLKICKSDPEHDLFIDLYERITDRYLPLYLKLGE
jgi:antitoxin component of MazEF toxin-antitoxin module